MLEMTTRKIERKMDRWDYIWGTGREWSSVEKVTLPLYYLVF